MSEFQRWRQEQEVGQQAIRNVNAPQMTKPTIEGDVLVPVFQALAISAVTTIAGAGLVWIFGVSLKIAARIGAGAGLAALLVCVVTFILQHRRQVTEPLDLLWERLTVARPSPPSSDEWEPPMIINPHKAALPASLDVEARSIEPRASREIEDLYKFIATMWPTGDISQTNCRKYNFTRKYWDRFIGGSRKRRDVGKESARGVLDRAGVIRKDGSKWVICAPLSDTFAINSDLLAYAEARSRMVVLSPTASQSKETGERG